MVSARQSFVRRHLAVAAGSLFALTSAGCGEPPAPVEVIAVEPNVVSVQGSAVARITGRNFHAALGINLDDVDGVMVTRTLAVRVGGETLSSEDVQHLDSRHLQVRIPAGLSLGWHAVSVTTPGGARATLDDALRVVSQLPCEGARCGHAGSGGAGGGGSVGGAPATPCAAGQVETAGSCFEFRGEHVQWSKALSECVEHGGYLAVLATVAEVDGVIAEVIPPGVGVVGEEAGQSWVGANVGNGQTAFSWHNGEAFTFADGVYPWKSDVEPNSQGGVEGCVDVYAYNAFGIGLNDEDCTSLRPYVCEFDP